MSNLSTRIQSLEADRAKNLNALEALLEVATGEDRDLNEAEQTAFEEAKSAVESGDQRLETLREAEVLLARAAEPVKLAPENKPDAESDAEQRHVLQTQRPDPQITEQPQVFKGAAFTRYGIAMAMAKGVPGEAERIAKIRWPEHTVVPALIRVATDPISTDENTATGGGSNLVTTLEAQAEFIELLRPMLIVTRIPGVRRMEFGRNGTITIPRQSAGVAGGYVGEGNSIMVERLNFEQVSMTPSKLATIVPILNEQLRRSTPSTEELIRDDMLQGTARTVDRVFLSELAAGPGPAGIVNGVAALPGAAIPAGANITNVTDAFRTLIMSLRNADIPMVSPVWLLHTNDLEYLRLQRGLNDDDFMWRDEINSGSILSHPFVDSTNVDNNWGGTVGDKPLVLVDANQIIWGEDLAPTIDFSTEAVIQSDTAPATPPDLAQPTQVNAFQMDATFFRIRMSHSWMRRRDEGIAYGISKL